MLCRDVMEILEQHSPRSYACEWDNVGLLVGSKEKDVKCIYIALDADDDAIAEAVEAKADLLLTHHPMIFKGLKKVNTDDFIGNRVITLIKNDIAYYAMHTNFDVSKMADLVAEKLNLTDVTVLQKTMEEGEKNLGIGKVGNLCCEMSLMECAAWVKELFELDTVKVFGCPDEKVAKVALCPGSGKSVIGDALKSGAQVLLTGDIDHHDGIDAVAQGLSIIDAGHYGLEKIFVSYMKQYLEEKLLNVKIIIQEPKSPFWCI